MPHTHPYSKVHLKASYRILFRDREVVHRSYPKWSGVPSPSAALGSFSLSLPVTTAWGFFLCPVSETSNSICRTLEPEFLLFWAHTAQRSCSHELFLMFSLYYLYNWSSPVGSLASNLGSFLNMMIYFFSLYTGQRTEPAAERTTGTPPERHGLCSLGHRDCHRY